MGRRLWQQLALAASLAVPSAAIGQYTAPPSYYTSAEGLTGNALRSALHEIIRGHTVISYANARHALQILDSNPSDPNELRLFYTGDTVNLLTLSGVGINGWDVGVTWQREHVWPRSRQITSPGDPTDSGADFSDLHMLRPAGSANQERSNLNFGGFGSGPGATSQLAGTTTINGATYYYPGRDDRGDAARASMYATVRYDGRDPNTVNLQLVNGNPAGNTGQMGDLQSLLRYHYEDPPDLPEQRRNHLIFSAAAWNAEPRPANWNGAASYAQGNRNPFVDRPELAWAVFSPSPNDSQITVSSTSVDLGKVMVGTPSAAATGTLGLVKTGSAPTYYEVATVGAARASNAGRYNAFSFGPLTGSSQLWLDTSTNTPGVLTGQVVYRNLDVTSSGPGRGSADADDVVDLSLRVVTPSRASLDVGIETKSLTLDFGAVSLGESAGQTLRLHNLVNVAGFTAGLDLDGILLTPLTPGEGDVFGGSGSTSAFVTSLTPTLTPIDAGDYLEFSIDFVPQRAGSFAAMLTLLVSDENIPGGQVREPLSLTLTGLGIVLIPEPGVLVLLIPAALLLGRRGRT